MGGAETREATVDVPVKEHQKRRPALHESEGKRGVSLRDGPAVAFTYDGVRIYDDSYDEFVELSNRELVELLASIYGMAEN
jgi:hypothetical protein